MNLAIVGPSGPMSRLPSLVFVCDSNTGMLRPITLWPFPTKAIAAYADKVKGMLVTELNAGQMVEDVRLAVNGKVKVEHFGRLGGIVPDPDEIVDALKEKLIKK